MAKKPGIPKEVKEQVERVVEEFNERVLKGKGDYIPRFRGRFLYLDRDEPMGVNPVCRLEYQGAMDKWEFAIYKFSTETYDPEEWCFPGDEFVDGTVEGAMKAGLEAYS